MPTGITGEVDALQQEWNNILQQLEEQYMEIVRSKQGSHERRKGQLNGIIKKARDAYQSKSLSQYNILTEKYKDHQPVCDLLSDCRDDIYYTLLEWENRLIPLQKHNVTQCAYC